MGAQQTKPVIEYEKTTQEQIAEFMEIRRNWIDDARKIVIKYKNLKDKTDSSESDKDMLKLLYQRFVQIHNHIKRLEKVIRYLKHKLADEEKWIVVPTIMEQAVETTTRLAKSLLLNQLSDEDLLQELDELEVE
jgi:hypothetical protein